MRSLRSLVVILSKSCWIKDSDSSISAKNTTLGSLYVADRPWSQHLEILEPPVDCEFSPPHQPQRQGLIVQICPWKEWERLRRLGWEPVPWSLPGWASPGSSSKPALHDRSTQPFGASALVQLLNKAHIWTYWFLCPLHLHTDGISPEDQTRRPLVMLCATLEAVGLSL